MTGIAPNPEARNSGSHLWKILLIVGVAGVLVVGGITCAVQSAWSSFTETRDSAVAFCKQAMDEVMPGYNGAAIHDRGTKYRRDNSTAEGISRQFRELAEPYGAYRGCSMEQWELGTHTDTGTTAHIVLVLEFERGNPRMVFDLVKVNGEWAFDNIEFFPPNAN